MSDHKHFTLYTNVEAANGWKVAIVLRELGLTYDSVYLDFTKHEHKSPEYLKLNPNGRIPALIDHENDDFVLWESDAILVYLVERYDTDHKLSAATDAERALQNQWLFFQASGQGPYFGQFFWFSFFHPEKIPSAVERYKKETERVLSVLDSVLSKKEWLVASKPTIADLSFVTWNNGAFATIVGHDAVVDKFPAVYKWHMALCSRPAVKSVTDLRTALQK
ncbi:glutathione S-transferase [Calocera cornea HHB12733]|uniref:glutathione transferase n=1 Tax=Calocera cornea HHB12733 TaxID=1353952 RepID=A0A165H1T5_9BASI|nr:glutathione S-transferase [Calocera cornea HHB12733]